MSNYIPNISLLTEQVNVFVIGAGGTGSELIAQLFKMNYILKKLGHQGIHVTMIDGDTVSPSNIGRQGFWENDVGQYKAQTLIERFNTFGGCDWAFNNSYAVPSRVNLRKIQIVFTCVDKASFRAELGEVFSKIKTETLWIDGGNDSHQGQVILGHLGIPEKDRLPNVYDLFPSLSEMVDNIEESCSHEQSLTKQDFGLNNRVASGMTNLLWQLLRRGELNHHGAFLDLHSGTQDALSINKDVWATFGYTTTKNEPKVV